VREARKICCRHHGPGHDGLQVCCQARGLEARSAIGPVSVTHDLRHMPHEAAVRSVPIHGSHHSPTPETAKPLRVAELHCAWWVPMGPRGHACHRHCGCTAALLERATKSLSRRIVKLEAGARGRPFTRARGCGKVKRPCGAEV
jgi:hypothetical protein